MAYELIGPYGTADPMAVRLVDLFAHAIQMFRGAYFDEALLHFERYLAHVPGDTAAEYYRRLCERYIDETPPPDWDATVRMTQK